MAKTENRTLDITTRVKDQLTKPFRKMASGVKEFAKRARASLGGVRKALFSLKGAVAGLIVAFGARRLWGGIRKTADELDNLVKTSQRLGVTVESLSALSHVAGLAGIELKEITSGLAVFSKNIEQARRGSLAKVDAMKTLGLTFADVEGQTLDIIDVLQKVSEGYETAGDATARTNALMEIFGRTGSKLGPLLQAGADGIAAQRVEAEKLGVVFSKEQAERAAVFNDSLLRLTNTLKGMAQTVFIDVAPTLSRALEEIKNFVEGNRDRLVRSLKSTAKSIAEFSLEVIFHMRTIGNAFRVAFSGAALFVRGTETVVLKAILELRKLRGASDSAILAAENALLNSADNTIGAATLLSEIWNKSMSDLVEDSDRAASSIEKLNALMNSSAGESGPQQFGPPRPPLEFAGPNLPRIGAEFQALLDSLKIRNLEGNKAMLAQTQARYEAELQGLNDLAAAHDVDAAVQIQAQELLRREYEKTRESIDGGFFAGMRAGFSSMFRNMKDATRIGREFASQVGSAIDNNVNQSINDWIDGTKTLKDAWKSLGDSILAELQRIIVKTLVLRAIGGVFSFAGGLIPSDNKAMGGVTGPIGKPMPLKRYAKGGIARRPQVAVFAEAGMNEAFVPLPDGNTIPVTLSGGAGGGTNLVIVNNIRAIDSRGVAQFFQQNSRTIVSMYDRALSTRIASRQAVRGAA